MLEELSYTVDAVDEVQKKVQVKVPASLFEKTVAKVFQRYTQEAQIQGFRKGKAPKAIIEKLYGSSIRFQAYQDLIESSWKAVTSKEKLPIVGDPQFDFENAANPEQGFAYTAVCAIWPTPKIENFDGVDVSVEKKPVDDAEVEKFLTQFREVRGTQKPIEGRSVAALEDIAEIEVKVAGSEADRAPEKLTLQLGRGNYLKQLEDAIVGMEIGSEKEVSLDPVPGATEDARKYSVKLVALKCNELPEVTDDFAASLGFGEVKTAAELRAKVATMLESERERQAKLDVQVAVIEKLVTQNPFKVPQTLVDSEIRGLLVRSGQVTEQDAQSADIEKFRAQFSDIAERRVRGAIIVDAVCDALDLKVTPEEVTESLNQEAERAGVSFQKIVKDRGVTSSFIELRRTKALNHLVEKAKVTYTIPKS